MADNSGSNKNHSDSIPTPERAINMSNLLRLNMDDVDPSSIELVVATNVGYRKIKLADFTKHLTPLVGSYVCCASYNYDRHNMVPCLGGRIYPGDFEDRLKLLSSRFPIEMQTFNNNVLQYITLPDFTDSLIQFDPSLMMGTRQGEGIEEGFVNQFRNFSVPSLHSDNLNKTKKVNTILADLKTPEGLTTSMVSIPKGRFVTGFRDKAEAAAIADSTELTAQWKAEMEEIYQEGETEDMNPRNQYAYFGAYSLVDGTSMLSWGDKNKGGRLIFPFTYSDSSSSNQAIIIPQQDITGGTAKTTVPAPLFKKITTHLDMDINRFNSSHKTRERTVNACICLHTGQIIGQPGANIKYYFGHNLPRTNSGYLELIPSAVMDGEGIGYKSGRIFTESTLAQTPEISLGRSMQQKLFLDYYQSLYGDQLGFVTLSDPKGSNKGISNLNRYSLNYKLVTIKNIDENTDIYDWIYINAETLDISMISSTKEVLDSYLGGLSTNNKFKKYITDSQNQDSNNAIKSLLVLSLGDDKKTNITMHIDDDYSYDTYSDSAKLSSELGNPKLTQDFTGIARIFLSVSVRLNRIKITLYYQLEKDKSSVRNKNNSGAIDERFLMKTSPFVSVSPNPLETLKGMMISGGASNQGIEELTVGSERKYFANCDFYFELAGPVYGFKTGLDMDQVKYAKEFKKAAKSQEKNTAFINAFTGSQNIKTAKLDEYIDFENNSIAMEGHILKFVYYVEGTQGQKHLIGFQKLPNIGQDDNMHSLVFERLDEMTAKDTPVTYKEETLSDGSIGEAPYQVFTVTIKQPTTPTGARLSVGMKNSTDPSRPLTDNLVGGITDSITIMSAGDYFMITLPNIAPQDIQTSVKTGNRNGADFTQDKVKEIMEEMPYNIKNTTNFDEVKSNTKMYNRYYFQKKN